MAFYTDRDSQENSACWFSYPLHSLFSDPHDREHLFTHRPAAEVRAGEPVRGWEAKEFEELVKQWASGQSPSDLSQYEFSDLKNCVDKVANLLASRDEDAYGLRTAWRDLKSEVDSSTRRHKKSE